MSVKDRVRCCCTRRHAPTQPWDEVCPSRPFCARWLAHACPTSWASPDRLSPLKGTACFSEACGIMATPGCCSAHNWACLGHTLCHTNTVLTTYIRVHEPDCILYKQGVKGTAWVQGVPMRSVICMHVSICSHVTHATTDCACRGQPCRSSWDRSSKGSSGNPAPYLPGCSGNIRYTLPNYLGVSPFAVSTSLQCDVCMPLACLLQLL